MSEKLTLSATERNGVAKAVVRSGFVPSVLYGRGIKTEVMQVNAKEFSHLLKKAGLTSIISLQLADKEHPVLIREVQYHPLREEIIHVDFYQVRMDEEIEAEVPLTFVGEAPAVKDLSGILVKNIDALKLKALPKDLPHEIAVDVSVLTDFEKVIHVADLTVPKGITLLQEATEVVALVQPPRSEEELEQLSEEVKEDVEAVEGIKKEEPVEGEAAVEAKEGDEKTPKAKE
jgi:large subunit ribosomal protein L25